MFKKILISEFFTTISFKQALDSVYLLSFWIKKLEYWKEIKKIEYELLSYLGNRKSKILSIYNWRSAIYHILKSLKLSNLDEVIISWYTCISVSNAVIQSGVKLIYSDINKKTLWLDVNKLVNNITKNTKVIIIQHTFWKASNILPIIQLAKENNILIIEDCAHSLWSTHNWKHLWTFWDFSIFSTWRDKVISSVTGWFLVINNKKYFKNIEKIKIQLKIPSKWLIIQNLLYNIVWYKSYIFYNIFKIWKIIIYISRKLNIITEILSNNEKKCNYNNFNYMLPNSLAYLALKQIKELDRLSNNRIIISEYYNSKITNKKIEILFKKQNNEINNYFRFPILLKTTKIKIELYNYMKNNDILLWNTWSWINIVPIWSDLHNAKYINWSCPISEDISKRILTLPNHKLISIKDMKIIVQLLNDFKK